jgi:hypothetical protein
VGGDVITAVEVGLSGRFDVALPPGRYVIHAGSYNGFDGADVFATVRPGRITPVRVTFSSGIG